MVFIRERDSGLGTDRRVGHSSLAEIKMDVSVRDLSRSERRGGQGCKFRRSRLEIAGASLSKSIAKQLFSSKGTG
jgi:hypothetical protein